MLLHPYTQVSRFCVRMAWASSDGSAIQTRESAGLVEHSSTASGYGRVTVSDGDRPVPEGINQCLFIHTPK